MVVSRVLGQGCMQCHWAPILLFSALYIKTSVIRFVCSDSQYELTAVFDDQRYGLVCIRFANILIII